MGALPKSTSIGEPRKSRRPEQASPVLVAVYIVLFVGATGRSVVQIVRDFDVAPVAYTLSAVAAAVYLLAGIAIALAHRNRIWQAIAAAAVGFELVGVLAVGTLSAVHPEYFPADTVWSGFGRGYLYIPFVLPLIGAAYLESRPATRMKPSTT
ncbi:hypothetical protein [uncultured Gulosibacter sp.]|uniref:hypothetical protein n=1 Tax=uncultured Gulosibacter sp. TaxID=1339167 RepID=UPI00288AC20F|nr:hypothetical protein [uncultured Gulosibacter sp.]